MRALSIRQPYAELILRGIKTVEYRTRPTRIVGERFWIYASKKSAVGGGQGAGRTNVERSTSNVQRSTKRPWSADLALPRAGALPAWMLELARQVRMIPPDALLPTGVIVGSACIGSVSQTPDGLFRWHLLDVERLPEPIPPTRHPQPTWFRPF